MDDYQKDTWIVQPIALTPGSSDAAVIQRLANCDDGGPQAW
jgi:hypothetical protein